LYNHWHAPNGACTPRNVKTCLRRSTFVFHPRLAIVIDAPLVSDETAPLIEPRRLVELLLFLVYWRMQAGCRARICRLG
jgi:hypothetical protein